MDRRQLVAFGLRDRPQLELPPVAERAQIDAGGVGPGGDRGDAVVALLRVVGGGEELDVEERRLDAAGATEAVEGQISAGCEPVRRWIRS